MISNASRNGIWRAACAAACLTLAACATDGQRVQIKTVTVDRPVPVSCLAAEGPDNPAPPVYADTPEALRTARDYAERDALVKGEWAKHMARESLLEVFRTTCMKVAP